MSGEQIILFGVIGIAAGIAYAVGRLEGQVHELREQVKRQRHTYATNDGIEDATAILIELILKDQAERQYTETRLNQAREILGMVRQGPQEYDRERPNGKGKKHASN